MPETKQEVIEINPTQVITFDVTEAAINEMKTRFAGMKADTAEEYAEVKLALKEVSAPRIAVEKRRKEVKEDHLEICRKIDAAAKKVAGLLAEVEDPLKATRKAYEDREAKAKAEKERIERERIDKINDAITKITMSPLQDFGCVEDMENALSWLEAGDLSLFGEFSTMAEQALITAKEKITKMIEDRKTLNAVEAIRASEMKEMDELRAKNKKLEDEAEEKRVAEEAVELAEKKAAEKAKAEADAETKRLNDIADKAAADLKPTPPLGVTNPPVVLDKSKHVTLLIEAIELIHQAISTDSDISYAIESAFNLSQDIKAQQ